MNRFLAALIVLDYRIRLRLLRFGQRLTARLAAARHRTFPGSEA